MGLHERVYRNLKGAKRPKVKGGLFTGKSTTEHKPEPKYEYQGRFGAKSQEPKYSYKKSFGQPKETLQPKKKISMKRYKTGFVKGNKIVTEKEQNQSDLMKDAKERQRKAKGESS